MIFLYFCKIFVPRSEGPPLTAKFISWWSVTHMCFLAFSHQHLHYPLTTSLQCSAEVRGKNMPDGNFASTSSPGLYQARFILERALAPLAHISYKWRTENLTKGLTRRTNFQEKIYSVQNSFRIKTSEFTYRVLPSNIY